MYDPSGVKHRLLISVGLLVGGCSLEGLADGNGGTGGSGTTTAGTNNTASTNATTGTGGGIQASVFTWVTSFGNELVQGTSPYATDSGSGSTIRISAPGPDGDVWVAAATKGAIDPDGSGGAEPAGTPDSYNLFVLRLDTAGEISVFRAFEGTLADIEDPLAVGAIERLPGGAFAVVGTIRGGSVDVSPAGVLSQGSATDDAYVIRFDDDGTPTHARQVGGSNVQSLRAATLSGDTLVVGGRFKRVLEVEDPLGGVDAACAYNVASEEYERMLVATFDPDTLVCTGFAMVGATDTSAVQQVRAVVADASGIYVAGSFTRQIVAAPSFDMPSSSGEDGFIVALAPDLSPVRWMSRLTSNRSAANDGLRGLAIAGGTLWVGGFHDRGTSAVMGMEPMLGKVDGITTNDCILPLADGRDGVVGRLSLEDGSCEGALSIGGAQEDEVRVLMPSGEGVFAGGFTTVGVPGLDPSAGGGSRDGFFALFVGPGVVLVGGRSLGGVSWDYLDALRVHEQALVLGGSYDASFDVLDGHADFWVGRTPQR